MNRNTFVCFSLNQSYELAESGLEFYSNKNNKENDSLKVVLLAIKNVKKNKYFEIGEIIHLGCSSAQLPHVN